MVGAGGLIAKTIGRIYCTPFMLPRDGTIDRLAIKAGAVATSVARFGIYASTADLGPGALVVDCGEVLCTAAGEKIVVVNVPLVGGTLYWTAVLGGVANPSLNFMGDGWFGPLGFAEGALTTISGEIYIAQAYGALPDPFPAGATSQEQVRGVAVWARFSA